MRNTFLSLALFPATLALASCSAASGDTAPASTPGPLRVLAGQPVEMPVDAPFTLASHGALDEPWAIAVEPGTGRLLITGKRGVMWLYNPVDGQRIFIEEGLPEVSYGGQGGFGDVAFAPDYATSRTIYLSWAASDDGTHRYGVAGRGTLECSSDHCRVVGLQEIWRQNQSSARGGHFSHRFAFSPDGRHLFIASGDRQEADPAQDLNSNLGKVLRLNLDGTPAAGNPFAYRGGVTAQIWSYGHRNPLGFAFDAQGRLWDLEHGPRGGDELNLVEPGNNYGWPIRSNGINYNGDPIPDHTPDDGFVKPVLHWTPVIAPGAMLFYRGNAFPAWRGNALAANLGTGTLVRIEIGADGRSATEAERWQMPRRLRGIAEAADGTLWLIEDGPGGRLLHLTPRR